MGKFDVLHADISGSDQEVDLVPQGEGLPCRVRQSMPRACGSVFCLLGSGVALSALLCLESAHSDTASFLLGIAILAGVVLAGVGIRFLVIVQDWAFTEDSVTSRRRGIFGWRGWKEPLSAYRGVVGRHKFQNEGLSPGAAFLHIVELKHRDRSDRDVRLYASSRGDKFRAKHAHYARLFGLPAITPTPAGEVVRQPEEADLPLRRRPPPDWVMFAAALPKSPPGDGLALSVADGVLTIATSRSPRQLLREALRTALVVTGGLLTTALPQLFDWAMGRPLFRTGLAVTVGIYVVVLFLRGELGSGRERLMLSADRLTYERSFPWRRRTEMHADSIDEVVVASQPGAPWERAVRITGDHGRIAFGRSLSRAEREWVRNCVIAALTA